MEVEGGVDGICIVRNIGGKTDISLSTAEDFLKLLWGFYVSDKSLHYEIFCINDKGENSGVLSFEGLYIIPGGSAKCPVKRKAEGGIKNLRKPL